MEADPELPRFTLVFDREAYSPKFFGELWSKFRVAVVTYRKNVPDKWTDSDFTEHQIDIDSNKVKMELCEKEIEIDNVKLREVRKKNNDSHQTSIVTTNKKLSPINIAIRMFSRWTQENFFKYLRNEYGLDHIVHYLINEINPDFKVVNPLHRKLTNKLKAIREKISRKMAKLYELVNENLTEDADQTETFLNKQSKYYSGL